MRGHLQGGYLYVMNGLHCSENQTREDEFQVYSGLKGAKRVTRFYDLVAANTESMKGR